jgi:lysophospholipase L1-like esterase
MRIAAHLLLPAGSVLLVLLAAESALRALGPDPGDGLRALHQVQPETPWLYALRPGASTTLEVSGDVRYVVNEAGQRGPEVPLARTPGMARILVLGDSLAFGYGVADPDSFPRRLAHDLAEARPVEVINFGVGGYNSFNEAAIFAGRGVAYAPDVVLVQFCINDLNHPLVHFDANTRLQLAALPDDAFPDPDLPRTLPQHGAACRACLALRLCERISRVWTALCPDPIVGEAFAAGLAPRTLPEGPTRRWLARHYGSVASVARESGARFAIVAFPHEHQLEAGASDEVQRQLAELADIEGWELIDLLPAFLAASQHTDAQLFLDLWHPTAAGHAVASRAIAARLRTLGWLAGTQRHPARATARGESRSVPPAESARSRSHGP